MDQGTRPRDQEELQQEFINMRRWAVVGVSENPEKYGNRVFKALLSSGYEVYGVNNRGGRVAGRALYHSLADLPVTPEVVDLVVPPKVTEQIVWECAELGLHRVWMQPGAESDEAIRFCHENGIEVVWDACAMAMRKDSWD